MCKNYEKHTGDGRRVDLKFIENSLEDGYWRQMRTLGERAMFSMDVERKSPKLGAQSNSLDSGEQQLSAPLTSSHSSREKFSSSREKLISSTNEVLQPTKTDSTLSKTFQSKHLSNDSTSLTPAPSSSNKELQDLSIVTSNTRTLDQSQHHTLHPNSHHHFIHAAEALPPTSLRDILLQTSHHGALVCLFMALFSISFVADNLSIVSQTLSALVSSSLTLGFFFWHFSIYRDFWLAILLVGTKRGVDETSALPPSHNCNVDVSGEVVESAPNFGN